MSPALWLLAPVSPSVYRRVRWAAGHMGRYYTRFIACCRGCGTSPVLVDLFRSILDLIWCVLLFSLDAVRHGLTLPCSIARCTTSKGLGTAALRVQTSGSCSRSTGCRHYTNSTLKHSRSGSLSSNLSSLDRRPQTCRPLTRPLNSAGCHRE